MAAVGMIDPANRAKYPVVLSDALLGKPSKEAYTGVRYNHKPELSSETAPSTARIKQAGQDGSFNLEYSDKGDHYTYSGIRTTKDGNYVLVFDPSREVFVLHRLDSLFHMNVTSTPDTSDVETLQKQFPQLEVQQPTASGNTGGKEVGGKGSVKKAPAKPKTSSALRRSTTKKQSQQQKKTINTPTMPPPPAPQSSATSSQKASASAKKHEPLQPAATSKSKRSRSPEPEEDDDDDDGLILEFPGGAPPPRGASRFIPPATVNRRFSELIKGGADEDELLDAAFKDDDADGEDDDDEMDMTFTSNFPATTPQHTQQQQNGDYEEVQAAPTPTANMDDDDFDDLEAAFEEPDGDDSESDVSEAD